jgi:hypothetical protein
MGLSLVLAAAGESLTLTAVDWPAPHTTQSLMQRPSMAALVEVLTGRDDRRLVIRHAGGEAGARFGAALRDALVALGVPSRRLRLDPAAAGPGQLILEIVTPNRASP